MLNGEATTEAARFAQEVVTKLLQPGSKYGGAAVLLTYREPGSDERARRIASALGLAGVENAADLVILIHRLRSLADELQALIDRQK